MKKLAEGSSRGLLWVALIGSAIVLLDQFTKWLAIVNLENRAGQPPVQVVGEWFQLTFIRNPGAAFSIGTQFTWVFSIAATAVAIVVLFAARKVTSKLWLVAMGALLGGAVGNLIDRFAQRPGAGTGHVVDFIEMPFLPIVGGTVFNVADIAVVGAAIFMVILSLLGIEPNPVSADEPDPVAVDQEEGHVDDPASGEVSQGPALSQDPAVAQDPKTTEGLA